MKHKWQLHADACHSGARHTPSGPLSLQTHQNRTSPDNSHSACGRCHHRMLLPPSLPSEQMKAAHRCLHRQQSTVCYLSHENFLNTCVFNQIRIEAVYYRIIDKHSVNDTFRISISNTTNKPQSWTITNNCSSL